MSVASATAARRAMPAKHVLAVVLGNALAFYDYLTYIYFAAYISPVFFPAHDPRTSRLLFYGAIFIGFLARPVGAMVIGPLGDRIGRKPAMMLSFALLGASIVGLGLTPSYASIGMAAPILVLVFRTVQGFALGGEVGPSTAFLLEAAPPERRGFYASLQYVTQDCAVLMAGIFATVLAHYLTLPQLESWGWRVAVLLGAAIVPFGLYIRNDLPETLHAADDAALAPDATTGVLRPKVPLGPYIPIIVFGLMMLTAGTIGSYVNNYMTTYAHDTLHLSQTVAFGVIIVNGGFSIVFELISGRLSDRVGRKPVILIPAFLLFVSIMPAFWLVTRYPTTLVFYGAVAWLTSLAAASAAPVIVALTEQFPKAIRSGAVATVYAFAISVFGGSTQFVLTWLDPVKHPLVPAWYWFGAVAIGLIAMVLVAESAPVKLRATRPPR